MSSKTAQLRAGVPSENLALFHVLRFEAHDPAAWIRVLSPLGEAERTLVVLRDIEIPRARGVVRADAILAPAELVPSGLPGGLSGDREVATAQAAAECLVREGVGRVVADRSLPLLFAEEIRSRGIRVECDPEAGVRERRRKDDAEVLTLRDAQRETEGAIEMACRTIARAAAGPGGVLIHDHQPLTAERVMAMIDAFLLARGFVTPGSIVAQAPHSFDCHHPGAGPLRTGLPVIVDVFPMSRATRYHGDCTRAVVHGPVPPEVGRMHAAVVGAKRAGIAALRAGVTGESVHLAVIAELHRHGYRREIPPTDAGPDFVSMQHGTGHGIGLSLKEPPLLEIKGPELVAGDAVTVEPGLYHRTFGGLRIEDLLIVRDGGAENLNTLHEGLGWT